MLQVRYQPQSGPSAPVKRRQGEKPLVLSSVDASGELKTNLVLSEEDASKLQQLSEETNVLKECRVIVVLAP